MSEHTPGPWIVTPEMGSIYREGHWEHSVAIVSHAFPEDERKANARLIAASPRMYDYIQSQAKKGDSHAAEILASI